MNENERIVLIFGKTGTGKSTKAKKEVENENRLVIIDPLHEYEGIIINDFFSFSEYIIGRESFRVSVRFDNDLDYKYLFKLIYSEKNICLLTEEAEIYISPKQTNNDFLRLVRYGRHTNIKIVGIARRATELSTDFRSQTNRIISFKQTSIEDIKKLELLGLMDLEKLDNHDFKEVIL